MILTTFCPITLPEGSKIMKIIVTVLDNGAGDITIYLMHNPSPSDDSTGSHSVGPSSSSVPQFLIPDFSSDPEPVEREVAYNIRAKFSSDQQASTLIIYRATVIYEFDPTYSGPVP